MTKCRYLERGDKCVVAVYDVTRKTTNLFIHFNNVSNIGWQSVYTSAFSNPLNHEITPALYQMKLQHSGIRNVKLKRWKTCTKVYPVGVINWRCYLV